MSDAVIQDEKLSKLALYRGLIALAWADHELHADEKSTLHEIISSHRDLTEDQRATLHDEVDHRVTLSDIWGQITDPQDRARLIDMANIIFQQDGDFCEDERALIEKFQAKHLQSIGLHSIEKDLASFTEEQARQREIEREELKAWVNQYGMFGRIKAAFRLN